MVTKRLSKWGLSMNTTIFCALCGSQDWHTFESKTVSRGVVASEECAEEMAAAGLCVPLLRVGDGTIVWQLTDEGRSLCREVMLRTAV